MFPMIEVQQPQPNDIVGSRIHVAGFGTGFEATLQVRVRDGNGQQLVQDYTMCGGSLGQMGQFHTVLELPRRPSTPYGFIEVFDDHAPGEGPYGDKVKELDKMIVPVAFGTHLLDHYVGFSYHMVLEGESLSAIARDAYGDASKWTIIYEANRDQIGDPDLIFSGQRLRIPS